MSLRRQRGVRKIRGKGRVGVREGGGKGGDMAGPVGRR